MTKEINIGKIKVGENNPIVIIAGPCAIENKETTFLVAETLKKISNKLKLAVIFKASYDKANRTSINSYRGLGIKEGLKILKAVKEKFKLPVLSDVHQLSEISEAKKVLDVIQIPAFLCRQTDLIVGAAKTGLPVNVKKAQFLAPWDVKNIIEKITSQKNEKIIITERGSSFGYNNLVVDMCSLPMMRKYGYPICFDTTHSLQLPGGAGTHTAGRSEFIFHLARAAVACGIDALFLEIHPEPQKALSDGSNMLALNQLEKLLSQVKKIDELVKKFSDE